MRRILDFYTDGKEDFDENEAVYEEDINPEVVEMVEELKSEGKASKGTRFFQIISGLMAIVSVKKGDSVYNLFISLAKLPPIAFLFSAVLTDIPLLSLIKVSLIISGSSVSINTIHSSYWNNLAIIEGSIKSISEKYLPATSI